MLKEERRVEIRPGYRLNLYDSGGEGAPVLLLHGRLSEWRTWLRQVKPLRRAGYRVLAVDLNGHGYSDYERKNQLWEHATDLNELLKKLEVNLPGKEKLIVVGHSDGASLAQQLAAQYPDSVKALVLVSGFAKHPKRLAFFSKPLGQALLRGVAVTRMTKSAYKRVVQKLFHWAFPSPAEAERALKGARIPEPEHFANHVKIFERFDASDLADRVRGRLPVLVVNSKGDRIIWPKHSAALAKLYNAQRVEIPGATHTPMFVDHREFNKHLLEFLASAAPTPRNRLLGS